MNLIILNKNLKFINNDKQSIVYKIKKNDDLFELKNIIDNKKPNNIISIDFAVQTNEEITNNEIIVAKETLVINSKPVDWSIPRVDRWIETSHDLNKSICDVLELENIKHRIGSGLELEFNKDISKRRNAKKWINENIKANFIDNNSNKISKLVNPENHNFSIIRIINNGFPLENSHKVEGFEKVKEFFKLFFFYRLYVRKFLGELQQKKILSKISKL
ncbi:MAG: hypothetical protein CL761_06220 [Chloroflexi bacterium]|nr:hypothetical protein [Chloroflexota bacterium]|tara:strand:+ start:41739 stop:42392 length:654 start_codon:yes stop_codon:yes gene_type:complete